jgi:hypothetical protein
MPWLSCLLEVESEPSAVECRQHTLSGTTLVCHSECTKPVPNSIGQPTWHLAVPIYPVTHTTNAIIPGIMPSQTTN